MNHGRDEKCTPDFRRKTYGKKPERPKRTWKDYNKKAGIKELQRENVDGIHLAPDKMEQRAPANTIMNFRILQNVRNFLATSATISFPRRNLFHEVS
jgi:hypothetical protein